MDEKLYDTLKSFGIDPDLVIPPNPAVEILDGIELNEMIIRKVGVEKGERVLKELRKAERVHSLMKSIGKEGLIPVKVWVRDPTKTGGGYEATRYVSPEEFQKNQRWLRAGVLPEEVEHWRKWFGDDEEAIVTTREWLYEFGSYKDAEPWLKMGFEAYKHRGLPEWARDAHRIKKWKEAGFTPEQMKEWIVTTGYTRVNEPSIWIFGGFKDPKEVKAWMSAGIPGKDVHKRVDNAKRWKEAGITPEEAEKWTRARVESLRQILKYKKEGKTPEDVVKERLASRS